MNAWHTRLVWLGALVAAVALTAVPAASSSVPGAQAVSALLRGIPQQGAWLGKKNAPVTLVAYADVQCVYCARFSRETFPTIVRQYVKTGRVRVLFRGLAFIGPDSTALLRWTFAAGRQNRLWNMLELLYANQGAENSGWATQARIVAVARSIPGLVVPRLQRDRNARSVTEQMNASAAAARKARVPGTPYFEVGPSLKALQPLPLKSFDPADLAAELDRVLTR